MISQKFFKKYPKLNDYYLNKDWFFAIKLRYYPNMSEFRANSFALKKKENDAAYATPDVLIKLSKWL